MAFLTEKLDEHQINQIKNIKKIIHNYLIIIILYLN